MPSARRCGSIQISLGKGNSSTASPDLLNIRPKDPVRKTRLCLSRSNAEEGRLVHRAGLCCVLSRIVVKTTTVALSHTSLLGHPFGSNTVPHELADPDS